MVVDEDGQRVGRLESDDPNWRANDVFALDEQMWRLLEILPEVSTMVTYDAVWVAAPANEEDEQASDPLAPGRNLERVDAAGAGCGATETR